MVWIRAQTAGPGAIETCVELQQRGRARQATLAISVVPLPQ